MKEHKAKIAKPGANKGEVRNPQGLNQYDLLYAEDIIGVRLYKEDDELLRKLQKQIGGRGLIVKFIRDTVREKIESGCLGVLGSAASAASSEADCPNGGGR
jgi:hypothetical protein